MLETKITYVLLFILKNFLWLPEALIIVRHRQVTPPMRELFMDVDYPADDPRKLKFWGIRQTICTRLIQANEYHALTQREYAIPPDTSPSTTDEIDLNVVNYQRMLKHNNIEKPDYLTERAVSFKPRDQETKDVTKTMRLLECVRLPRRNWFIAFNRSERRMFLIEEVHGQRRELRWTASLEPKSEYNLKFTGPQKDKRLFRYFSDQVKSETDQNVPEEVPMKMTLCSLSMNEHLRLCSVVFETLIRQSFRYYHQNESRRINYVNLARRRCMNKQIELEPHKLVKVNALPCPINRAKSKPQFFLLADIEAPGAVFVLHPKKKKSDIKLTDRVEKIALLLERREEESNTPLVDQPGSDESEDEDSEDSGSSET